MVTLSVQSTYLLVWVVQVVHSKLDQIHDPHPMVLYRPALQDVLHSDLSKGIKVFENIRLDCEQINKQFLAN